MRRPQLLLHYPVDLPADYDMGIIRARVRTGGSALDDRDGLGCKAYCIREVDVQGSLVNQYAPFYLWDDAGAAAHFLWGGGGFGNIVESFGRPVVHTWVPAAFTSGPVAPAAVTTAWFRSMPISHTADLGVVADRLAERVTRLEGTPALHLAVAGINPASWEIVEFATTAASAASPFPDPTNVGDTAEFSVLHISQPGSAP